MARNSLYSDHYSKPSVAVVSAEHFDIDAAQEELALAVEAYGSVSTVMDVIAAESFSFVQPGNLVLFNQYTSLLQRSHKVTAPQPVSALAFETASIQMINHQLALEGWMGDIWAKIKNFFKKIYAAITEFFKKHFTRLGKVKKRLENIQEVLKETKSELKPGSMVDADLPSKFESRYAGYNAVTPQTVGQTITIMEGWMGGFVQINAAANKLAKANIVGPDFVTQIKQLRDRAAGAASAMKDNDAEKKKIGLLKGMSAEGREKKAQIADSNKTLAQVQKDAVQVADHKESAIDQQSTVDAGTEDANSAKAVGDFMKFVETCGSILEKSKGKTMIEGYSLKGVTVSQDKGLEIDMDQSSDKPTELTLGGKVPLTAMCKQCIDMIAEAEKTVAVYSAVNDEIMKQVDSVDALVKDIDKFDPERYGKYRKVLTQQVQTRLKLLQAFFRNYNQIGKNVYTHTLSTAEGYIDFALLSLKHFA